MSLKKITTTKEAPGQRLLVMLECGHRATVRADHAEELHKQGALWCLSCASVDDEAAVQR